MTWHARSSTGPLNGIKVIDITTVVFGPFATKILGDLGADVLKVEHGKGDVMRGAGRSPADGLGPIYLNLNRNKRSIDLDLSQDQAKDRLRDLVREADVFIHNVREAGMARLGFSYDAVRELNPNIVYVHCCGFGKGGAYEGRQAYDDLVQAASGLAGLLPISDGMAPKYLPTLIADKTAGLYASYATIAALYHRERTGEGQLIEIPMLEAVTHLNMVENLYGHTFVPPTGNVAYTRSINPRRKPFATKDGYIAIVPYSEKQWEDFFELGGRPGVLDDDRFREYKKRTENIGELYKIIEEVALTKTTDEWLEILDRVNIPSMRYNPIENVADDPHLASVNFFEEREHPEAGVYKSIKHPVEFSKTPTDIRNDARPVGADTEEIFGPSPESS
ncbi:MAG: CoA transferase [Pseudomonadota bacterium]